MTHKINFLKWLLPLSSLFSVKIAFASLIIPMYLVDEDGKGKSIGTVKAENSICGVLFTPNLHDLPPGLHGFHIHELPSCLNNGSAAGDHFDPSHSEKHQGPFDKTGHLGDLPVLIVDQDGSATLPTLAPRFPGVSILKGHALIIHAGSDNYSDNPKKNGGGGDRIACGVIDKND